MSCERTQRGLIKMYNWSYTKRAEKQEERKYLRQHLLKNNFFKFKNSKFDEIYKSRVKKVNKHTS